MHVGFVGTGNMGFPMAANVVKAGHRMTVYDARREATSELERLGATRATDLPSLARAVRMTLLSLPNERVVEAVVLGVPGAPGLLAGAQPGDLVFDLSTVSPDSTRRLAALAADRGVRLIDAPVSGSVSGARAGTLAVMIGASEQDVAPWKPTVVSVELGMNDQGGFSTEQFIANMGKLDARIKSVGARPVYFTSSPVNSGEATTQGRNAKLHQFAARRFSRSHIAAFARHSLALGNADHLQLDFG